MLRDGVGWNSARGALPPGGLIGGLDLAPAEVGFEGFVPSGPPSGFWLQLPLLGSFLHRERQSWCRGRPCAT